jgi:predicted dehydrogenase
VSANASAAAAPIAIIVVGFGRMGRRHVDALLRSPDFDVVAVIDSDPAQVAAARALGLLASTRLTDVVSLARAAVIAVPTEAHAETFEALSSQGIDCLVEKPIGISLAQLNHMGAVAERNGTRIFAGYCERFHPAILALRAASTPRLIEICRTSQATPSRRHDIDVMLDLLVHDLDWLYSIIDEEPLEARVESSRSPGHQIEEVICQLRFANGLQARLTASRMAAVRQRAVTVTHAEGELGDFSFDAPRDAASEDNLGAQARALAAALRGLPSTIAGIHDARRVMSLVDRLRESDQPLRRERNPLRRAMHDG